MPRCRRRTIVIMAVVVGAASTLSGCASLLGRRRQAQDDRFETFSEYVPEKLEVRTDPEPLEKRMPGVHFASAHWVAQYRQEKREMLPYPDRPLWVNAVVSLDPEATRAFTEALTGEVERLPGIYSDLRQYVPKDDVFAAVAKEKANEIIDVEHMVQDDPGTTDTARFRMDQVAVCAGSNLLILIATEYHM